MSQIEVKVIEMIATEDIKRANEAKINEFQQALNEFNTLVERQLISRRGNNLLSSSDSHLKVTRFNVVNR